MARTDLTAVLDAITGPSSERRRPAYKIEVYDIRSTSANVTPTTINDVVRFLTPNSTVGALPVIVGPRDFTNDCQFIDVVETGPDYVETGIAAGQITVRVVDANGTLDPVGNPAPADGRYMRQSNVVVVREGDEEVAEVDWPITFIGGLVGQPSYARNRTTGESTLVFKANSREVDFVRRINTTRNFLQSTTYASIITSIATEDMGLNLEELNLPTFQTRSTSFRATQFVEESPLISIAKLMFIDGFMPTFQGDGRLSTVSSSLTKASTRSFSGSETQLTISRPLLALDGMNEVELIGLDPDMSAVIQGLQVIAKASVTSGFFTNDIKIPVEWSADKTQQAFNVSMRVIKSVEAGIFNFGSESFTNFPSAVDGGSVAGQIDVDGALAQSIIIASILAGAYIAAAYIPDLIIGVGIGAITGFTISVGRIVQALITVTLFQLVASVGSGQYEILGQPYEYVFQEIRTIARIAGIRSEDRKGISIENHLVNTVADCDAIAERILRRERAKQNRRTITMLHDLRLETDDIFEIGLGLAARRYVITRITRRLQRQGTGTARYDCFEITTGVSP